MEDWSAIRNGMTRETPACRSSGVTAHGSDVDHPMHGTRSASMNATSICFECGVGDGGVRRTENMPIDLVI